MLNTNEVGALEYLQTIPSEVLSQLVNIKLTLNKLIKVELSYRGQDSNGKWIGFNDASKHHQISV